MITPADSASSPQNFAEVTPHGRGPAPYDIQAPQQDLTAEFGAANAASGAGVLYPQSDRQSQTEKLIASPPGYGDFTILGGSTEGWSADITP